MFFKIDFLKNFAIFAGKHLCWSLFSIKLFRRAILLKRDSSRVFSCELCKIFKNKEVEQLFYVTPFVPASVTKSLGLADWILMSEGLL